MTSKKLAKPMWTVVQHSAYGYKHDYQFQHGLESQQLERESELALVRKEGGQLFEDYMEAEDYCMDEMYPKEQEALTPRAPGTFSRKCLDGLAIYRPRREEE